MSRSRIIGHGGRRAGIALVMALAIGVMAGCATDVRGPDRNSLTFWKGITDNIIEVGESETCNLDENGDGIRGLPEDRARCALQVTRITVCPLLNQQSPVTLICHAATTPTHRTENGFEMWFSLLTTVQSGGFDCLAIDWEYGGAIKSWRGYDLGQRGCRR